MRRIVSVALAGTLVLSGGVASAQMTMGGGPGVSRGYGPTGGVGYGSSGGGYPSAGGFYYSTGPSVRRHENRPCTEVVIEGLPVGAQLEAVVVYTYAPSMIPANLPENIRQLLMANSTQGMKPAEEAVVATCHQRSVNDAGAVAAPANLADGSLELGFAEMVLNQAPKGMQARAEVALMPELSRLKLTADGRGRARFFVPRENFNQAVSMSRGFTVGVVGFKVVSAVLDETTATSAPILLPDLTLINKDRVALNVGRAPYVTAMGWTDNAGGSLSWDGRRFRLAQR